MKVVPTAVRLGPRWLPRGVMTAACTLVDIFDRQSATSIAQSANVGPVTMIGYAGATLS